MYVARSGGQVREQEIERSPFGLVDHLLEGADRHGAAPQKGVGRFDEESDRHEAYVHRLGRNDAVRSLLLHRIGQVPLHAEHLGLRGTVNIGVENSDAVTHVAQCDGEVGRHGGLSYPAFARCHGDHFGDAAGGRLELGFGPRRSAALLDDDHDVLLREFTPDNLLGLVFDFHRERVAGLGETEYDGDLAGSGGDMLDKAAADDVLSRFGMDDGRQQMSDFFFHDSCCDYNRKDNVYFAE